MDAVRNPFPLARERTRSALAVAALHGLLGYALVAGLGFEIAPVADERLKLFDLPAEAPPPPAEEIAPAAIATPEPEGAAAPPNLRARPVPVVAPQPEIRIERPPPVVAAPVAGPGPDPSAGASDTAGPGTGAGGVGDGLGSGGAGSGTGGGGAASRPKHRSGRITERDLPRAAWRGRARGSVTVRLAVEASGRVSGCTVARSSGDPELDALTCRLIRERFRYEPARDRRGRAVPGAAGWRQDWWQGRG